VKMTQVQILAGMLLPCVRFEVVASGFTTFVGHVPSYRCCWISAFLGFVLNIDLACRQYL
jgi:hypothetical protein